jgi:hypothetical protein
MIPVEHETDNENDSQGSNDAGGNDSNSSLLGGPGTPITNVGVTYYPQQAVAVQLTGMNTGR